VWGEFRPPSPEGTTARFKESEWQVGWVVGGGIEFALDDAWSINAEYLYADFGTVDGDSDFPGSPLNFTQDTKLIQRLQIARGGISYRF
jgi:outer membrane immunogenic protein